MTPLRPSSEADIICGFNIKVSYPMQDETNSIKELAYKTLDDNKAININQLDVTELTNVTDCIIICSATSKRHASSLADKLVREMKNHQIQSLGVEGENEGEWILVDLNHVVVHIMLPSVREFYDLEKLWSMTEKFRQQHEG